MSIGADNFLSPPRKRIWYNLRHIETKERRNPLRIHTA